MRVLFSVVAFMLHIVSNGAAAVNRQFADSLWYNWVLFRLSRGKNAMPDPTPDPIHLDITRDPAQADLDHLGEQLKAYNNTVSPAHRAAREPGYIKKFAVFLRDPGGAMVGGVMAEFYWDWMFVAQLWIHADLRGQGYGQRLLALVEDEARERGIARAYIQTFSFQAKDFYARYGYRVVGALEDYPPGETFYWLRKDF